MWEPPITPLLALLSDLTRALTPPHDEATVPGAVAEVAEALVTHLPGVDGVAVALLAEDEEAVLLAETGALARALYDAQAALDDGPCLQAFRTGRSVHVDAAQLVTAWPGLADVVARTGLRAQCSAPLLRRGRAAGVVTLFSTTVAAVPAEAQGAGEHAAALVSTLLELTRLQRSTAAALETRSLIGQAIGVVMERYGLGADRALDYLKRLASDGEVKLRVLAQDVVDRAARRGEERDEAG